MGGVGGINLEDISEMCTGAFSCTPFSAMHTSEVITVYRFVLVSLGIGAILVGGQ